MEQEQNITPVKSKFACIDLESPTCLGTTASPSDSPAYVEWDFDVPDVPDKIKIEALALGKELKEDRVIRRRKRNNKAKPYSSFNRKRQQTGDMTPKRSKSYNKSLNILKEALGEGSKVDEDDKKSSSPSQESNLFDDSLNDCLNLCSQVVEDNFYNFNLDTESKTNILKHKENSKVGALSDPITSGDSSGQITGSSSYDVSQAFNEVDDDFFLDIDISKFN